MIARPTTRVAAAVAGLALVAASCGGGDSADPATTDATSTATAPSTDAPAGAPADTADPATDAPDDTAADAATADAAPVDDTATAPAAVPAALQFSAPLVGGGEIDATTLAGTPTAFWFWAPT
ncbi:hypothetical protein [Ilumatobacter coccineus]|uniref:Uncharacterized protein n=1 Tax=Ilumatobacter coccineus (strain NBRC 103263 / KCTC 29153 / YM16-304) TaxID=1313172 RepID=A0A6C7EBA9_ILUCY|nr:hypothetical protein [Ilumatobacter coccineus]BAN03282.1 hypothetical protein YM304_29680 [Ilumatobacter coccineus YM16-304]